MDIQGTPFASDEIELFWSHIRRTLERLVQAQDALAPELQTWRPPAPETNSVFNLVAHTIANAEVNVYQVLLGQAYDRDREAEFAHLDKVPAGFQDSVIERIDAIESTLRDQPPGLLEATCTHFNRGQMSGRAVFIIVARHAGEHAGQAELTRDLALAAQH